MYSWRLVKIVRVVFEERLRVETPLDALVDRVQKATRELTEGRVVGKGEGFHLCHSQFRGGQYYFHNDYSGLQPLYFRSFPGLYSHAQEVITNGGVSPLFINPLLSLMATNEHAFLGAATVKLPEYAMDKLPAENAGLGLWGVYDYEAAKRIALRQGMSIEECVIETMPRYKTVFGQTFLLAPGRANRPMPNGSDLEREIFRSNFYGFGQNGNPEAVLDMLFTLVRLGKLNIDRSTIDEVIRDPNMLASFGIGPMVEGYGKVLSFDSAENNLRFASALDHSLSTVASIRDLSPLALIGVKAVSIVNMFSPFTSQIDPQLIPYLESLGYDLEGNNRVAKGFGVVTYSTGFERGVREKTIEGYEAMLRSMQLAGRKIVKEGGYKNFVVIIGQNTGDPASSSHWHTQLYILLTEEEVTRNINQPRIQPKKWNELYEDGGVRILAAGYDQTAIQLKTDGNHYKRSFLDRGDDELRSLARGLYYNEAVLRLMGFNHRVEYTRGNDVGSSVLSPEERRIRKGFGEFAIQMPIISSIHQFALPGHLQGDVYQFVADYRRALKDFLCGKTTLC